MNPDRYRQFLIQITKEALDNSDGTPLGAYYYLASKKKPGFLAPAEKKEALQRTLKIFSEMRDRPTWLVLKALGLSADDLAT